MILLKGLLMFCSLNWIFLSLNKELPLPRFMALKNDTEVRYGTPAEFHGVKFQVPHATLEKNSYKRTDEGDKQVTGLSPSGQHVIMHPPFGSSSVNDCTHRGLLNFSILHRRWTPEVHIVPIMPVFWFWSMPVASLKKILYMSLYKAVSPIIFCVSSFSVFLLLNPALFLGENVGKAANRNLSVKQSRKVSDFPWQVW